MATVPQEDDVDQILTRMMAVNSPLLKQAKTQGLQQAQNLGLGQSTMGIKAAQAAAYQAAVPLASQQAQQVQQTKMQQSQFGHETGMQTAGFQHAATQAELDRAQQMNVLNQSEYLGRLKMHEGIAADRVTQDLQRQWEAGQNAAQRSMQERLASMELYGADRERTLSALSNVNNSWNAAMSQITANSELPSDARNYYVNLASQARDHQYNVIASMMRAGGVVW